MRGMDCGGGRGAADDFNMNKPTEAALFAAKTMHRIAFGNERAHWATRCVFIAVYPLIPVFSLGALIGEALVQLERR